MSTQLANDATAATAAILETQLVIDNVSRAAENGAVYERRSPTTGQVVTRAAAASAADAIAAADSAQGAFLKWSRSAPSERRRVLLKAADILETKTPAIIEAMAKEVGAAHALGGLQRVPDRAICSAKPPGWPPRSRARRSRPTSPGRCR